MTLKLFIMPAILVHLSAPMALYGRIVASEGPVRRGEWNSNMTAVIDEARSKRIPMLLVLENQGCSYCARLMNALDGAAFNLWRTDRNILMAYIYNSRRQSRKTSPQTVRKAIPFFKASRSQNMPMVYVWWPKPDGSEVGKSFLGRRDAMGGEPHDLLSMEFMSAVDKVLSGYLSSGLHRTLDQILKDCPKKIAAAVSSSGGTVTVDPPSGILKEGGKVVLKAKAAKEYVFLKWIGPDGNSCGHHEELLVTGSMQEGTYTAHFKAVADIRPPIPIPAYTSFFVKAGAPFKYIVPLNEDCLPVSFKHEKLPAGVRFDSCHGILEGTTKRIGTNAVNIKIIGSDARHTVATNQVMLIVKPKSELHKRRASH